MKNLSGAVTPVLSVVGNIAVAVTPVKFAPLPVNEPLNEPLKLVAAAVFPNVCIIVPLLGPTVNCDNTADDPEVITFCQTAIVNLF